ncbi:MAG: hypothetical protein FWE95_07200 [Planctomycetaceae bacterium]|nr:hypothetical protein [Planctomycetaceae bacterium]
MDQEQKKTSKGPFIGGCVLGLVIGIVISFIGAGIIASIASFQKGHVRLGGMLTEGPAPFVTSSTEMLGQYELTDADAVKEFNSRVKKWFVERGFVELEDMPLRSIERMPTSGNWMMRRRVGDWDKPGVLLLLKFDDQNSLYILVPDCYQRERHVQMIGYRFDLAGGSDKTRGYEIQLDKLKDDFERAFPSGKYNIPNAQQGEQ